MPSAKALVMILVARKPPVAKEVIEALEKRGRSGLTELEEARQYYALKPPPTNAYYFKRYTEWAVRAALQRQFHNKCAYCESRYAAVGAWQVEHFRPKGKVEGAPAHPGYWWLAGKFENLFPSCIDCNQRKFHVEYRSRNDARQDIERLAQVPPTLLFGKGINFPVTGGRRVMTEHEPLSNEDPLLIDPCERDPAAHLEWVFDYDRQFPLWEAVPVLPFLRPRHTATGADEYASNSIAFYGLNRLGVFRERLEHLNFIQRECERFVKSFMQLVGEPDADSEHYRQLRADHRRDYDSLAKHASADSKYAGMARAFVAQVKTELLSKSSATEAS